MKKTALIFANGEIGPAEIELVRDRAFDTIIAADGGAAAALRWDYRPEVVVGDLDSITPEIRARLGNAALLHRPDQEINDLEKALQYCRDAQVEAVTLLGAGGKRLDHTLNNLSVLSRYDQLFDLTIYDAHSQIFIVRDRWQYRGALRQLISLIPIGAAQGVTTEGLAFPLRRETLRFGRREGLSNYIVSNPVQVTLEKGLLLIFVIR